MPPKKSMSGFKSRSSIAASESVESIRALDVSFQLFGEYSLKDCNLFVYFNKTHIVDTKWVNGLIIESVELPINLKDANSRNIAADNPIIFLTRNALSKGSKDPDPLLHPDNHGGASLDLLPIILGEVEINTALNLVTIGTGQFVGCKINVNVKTDGPIETDLRTPLLMTLISAHCLPPVKDGSAYIAAVGIDDLSDVSHINFGMAYSKSDVLKVVWATASSGRCVANTEIDVPKKDLFIPEEVEVRSTRECSSVHWNAMKRVLVDPLLLKERLSYPFFIDVAAVPATGKTEVRGRYMGYIDAKVLLECGIFGVTICVDLKNFCEPDIPAEYRPLLDLPPHSAKLSARDNIILKDEFGHTPYLTIRFDLFDNLIHKTKISSLFETIGFPTSVGAGLIAAPKFDLLVEPQAEDPSIDVRRIRRESGALAVHKELGSYTCQGFVPMHQSIKRTAANRLLMRVRTMLKEFSPGDVSKIDWQDYVSRHHAASRKAVTSSFAPQPPPLKIPERSAVATCRRAGDDKTAKVYLDKCIVAAPGHSWPLLSKALRCLEERRDSEAHNYVMQALTYQTSNRILLWIYGAMNFNKISDIVTSASAAFRIAVKGSYSDGTTNTIGWAALHALLHFNGNPYGAFVAATKMRKAFELPIEWGLFILRWKDTSGEREIFWNPEVVSSHNPILMAAAFFLCLRCYKFVERLLLCYENGCSARGAQMCMRNEICHDVFYLKAASFLMRGFFDEAINTTNEGIKLLGPSPMMSQMKTACLAYLTGWNEDCDHALLESEKAGSELSPFLLLRAAKAWLKNDPHTALQQAAAAHKITRCAYSALLIARVYMKLDERNLAERWAAVSVKLEPLLADGWAVLGIIAMYERHVEKAKTMLRTSRQVGSMSADVSSEVKKTMQSIGMTDLAESLVKDLCLCKLNYL